MSREVTSLKKIIYDGDPGIDDALAILLALKSGEVKLEAITTVAGNATLDKTTDNVLKILELVKCEHIPVARGIAKPLLQELRTSEAHGEDGLGNTYLPSPKIEPQPINAVNKIITEIMNNPNEITVVTGGPLTNLAVATILEPLIKDNVKEVIVMGGAISVPGNVTPHVEFNIYSDPEAAKIVFQSELPITLVPLDVTMKTLLTPEHLAEIEETHTPVAEFAGKAITYYMNSASEAINRSGCPLHDPLAIGVAIDRSIIETKEFYVDVETKCEKTRGKTIADIQTTHMISKRKPNMDVCLEVDCKRFLEIFVESLKSW